MSNSSNNKKLRLNENTADCSSSSEFHRLLMEETERFEQWQLIQFAKCIDENTINRILESYLRIFEGMNALPSDSHNPGFTENLVELPQTLAIENARQSSIAQNDNRFEESAILMAISEHGLQQTIPLLEQPSTSSNCVNNIICNNSNFNINNQNATSSSSSSSIIPLKKTQVPENNINASSSSSSLIECNNLDELKTSEQMILISNHKLIDESPPESAMLAMVTNDTEHLDFMEAAVAAAIQKKGLTPYTISMSPTR